MIAGAGLNPAGSTMVVKVNTQETANGSSAGIYPQIGSRLPLKRMSGTGYVEIRNMQPLEVLVLINHP